MSLLLNTVEIIGSAGILYKLAEHVPIPRPKVFRGKSNKPAFVVRAGPRSSRNKEGILVWISRENAEKFPKRAKDLVEWSRDFRDDGEGFRTVQYIHSDSPNADEEIIEAIVKAKALAADWSEEYTPLTMELSRAAERAIKL